MDRPRAVGNPRRRVPEIEHDDVVGLASLRRVDGAELDAQPAPAGPGKRAAAAAVAPQHEHGERRAVAAFELLDVVQCSLQAARGVVAGDDGDALVAHAVGGSQRALRLRGVRTTKARRGLLDPAGEAEGAAERPLPHVAQVAPAVADERDVAAGETVDRLPVVAPEEVGDARALERLEQCHPARGDVLELVHQYVAVGRRPAARPDVRRGVVDQVVEVLLVAEQLS